MPVETDKNEAPTLPFVCYKLPKRSSILPEALNPDVFVWVLETPEDCSTSMKTFVDKVRSALTLRYDGVLPQHIATALNEPEPVNVVPATKVLAAQQEKLSPSIPQSQRSSRISKATGSGLRSNLGASSQTNRCFSRQPKNPVLVHQQPGFSFQPLPKEVRDYLVRVDGDIDLATLLHRLRYERRQQQKQYIQHNAQKLVHDAYFGTNSDTRQSDLQCRTLGTSLASPEVTGLESSQYAAQLEQNSVPLDRFSMPISQRCHVNATVDTSSELCAPCSGSTAAQTSSAADGSTLSSKKRRFSALPSLSTTTSMPNSDSLREPSLSLESRQALCHEMAAIAEQLLSQAALLSASNFIDYHFALSSFTAAPNRLKSQDQSVHERITNCVVKLSPSALFGSDLPCNNTYDDYQRLFTNACLSLKETPK